MTDKIRSALEGTNLFTRTIITVITVATLFCGGILYIGRVCNTVEAIQEKIKTIEETKATKEEVETLSKEIKDKADQRVIDVNINNINKNLDEIKRSIESIRNILINKAG